MNATILQWCASLLCNQGIHGSNTTAVRFQSSELALSELPTKCTMAWIVDRQVIAMLYPSIVSVDSRRVNNSQPLRLDYLLD